MKFRITPGVRSPLNSCSNLWIKFETTTTHLTQYKISCFFQVMATVDFLEDAVVVFIHKCITIYEIWWQKKMHSAFTAFKIHFCIPSVFFALQFTGISQNIFSGLKVTRRNRYYIIVFDFIHISRTSLLFAPLV